MVLSGPEADEQGGRLELLSEASGSFDFISNGSAPFLDYKIGEESEAGASAICIQPLSLGPLLVIDCCPGQKLASRHLRVRELF